MALSVRNVQPQQAMDLVPAVPRGRDPTNALRIARTVSRLALPIVVFGALASLPRAEAFGGPGTFALPVCLAGCIAILTTTTGGWGTFFAWTACKAACVAAAVAF